MHLSEATKAKVVEVLYKKPNGLIIILPSRIQSELEWRSLQEFFCRLSSHLDTHSLPIPVYFAFEDRPTTELYQLLKEAGQENANGAGKCKPP